MATDHPTRHRRSGRALRRFGWLTLAFAMTAILLLPAGTSPIASAATPIVTPTGTSAAAAPALSSGTTGRQVVALPSGVRSPITSVSLQYDGCVVSNGTVWCREFDAEGGPTTGWAAVTGSLSGQRATAVSVSYGMGCALAGGRVHCWKSGSSGAHRASVIGHALKGKTVTQVSVGDDTTCAVAAKRAYCWGLGRYGQLGNGKTKDSSVPVAVRTSGVLKGKSVTDVAVGSGHSCAVAAQRAYCWGSNVSGQLGQPSVSTRVGYPGQTVRGSSSPVAVSTKTGLKGLRVSAVSLFWGKSCALADAKVFCWGEGWLGNGKSAGSKVPVQTSTYGSLAGKKVRAISAGSTSCALTAGAVSCWDSDDFGLKPKTVRIPTALKGRAISGVSGSDHNGILIAYR